ncbi:hypothetical protein [Cohaesibacter celericrescens]|uniref:EAL domain-containing protein n=1 Tax=Cohaesibacter celericrescens TaxID=2067669 RepID=A0A2N5XXF8_9HYPH|nr:hypothetical protein [Cohaesibacter celericrescens]PLW79196.1 hypothetical protein C0081_02960 [Cohaesibacter celericrescens]
MNLPPKIKNRGLASADSHIFYRPIWHVKANALMAFRPEAISQGQVRTQKGDMAFLTSVLDVITKKDKNGQNTLALLPIRFKFLIDQSNRKAFLEILKMLQIDMRNRLVIEISEIPAAIEGQDLKHILDPFKAYCRGFICLSPIDERNFRRFSFPGVFATGFDLRNNNRGEVELIDRITRFVSRASALEFKVIGHGIQTISLATNAVCGGVNFLSGDAIHEPIPSADGAVHFKPAHLFGLGQITLAG